MKSFYEIWNKTLIVYQKPRNPSYYFFKFFFFQFSQKNSFFKSSAAISFSEAWKIHKKGFDRIRRQLRSEQLSALSWSTRWSGRARPINDTKSAKASGRFPGPFFVRIKICIWKWRYLEKNLKLNLFFLLLFRDENFLFLNNYLLKYEFSNR